MQCKYQFDDRYMYIIQQKVMKITYNALFCQHIHLQQPQQLREHCTHESIHQQKSPYLICWRKLKVLNPSIVPYQHQREKNKSI